MSLYAVNGKEPVAAWIPSLDTAGNGTTTLTDLVGSNNGTLTNMDAATDWVADTGAGGVRALDVDGTDDYVATSYDTNFVQNTVTFGVSMWLNRTDTSRRRILGSTLSTAEKGFFLMIENGIGFGNNALRLVIARGNLGDSLEYRSPDSAISTGWTHVCVTGLGGTSVAMYINGSAVAVSTHHTGSWTPPTGASDRTLNLVIANAASTSIPFYGRIDDCRVFDVALDASDASYFYNSGNGRGRVSLPATYFTGIRSYNRRRKVGT
jgi:hypothetical protein